MNIKSDWVLGVIMTCYSCEKPETSLEHVPPQCFFIKGRRGGLITVPSCEEHNQAKSKDDEYVRLVLLSSHLLENNDTLEPLFDVHLRSLKRAADKVVGQLKTDEDFQNFFSIEDKWRDDPAFGVKTFSDLDQSGVGTGLLGLISYNYQDEVVVDSVGVEQQVISYEFDQERFFRFFKSVAKGLFYHEMQWSWLGEVMLVPHDFISERATDYEKKVSSEFLGYIKKEKAEGEHPGIFYYNFFKDVGPEGEDQTHIVNFCFYETFKFTAVFNGSDFLAPSMACSEDV